MRTPRRSAAHSRGTLVSSRAHVLKSRKPALAGLSGAPSGERQAGQDFVDRPSCLQRLVRRSKPGSKMVSLAPRRPSASSDMLLEKPTLPKKPRKPDGRRVPEGVQQCRIQKYDLALAAWEEAKQHYDTVLYPAYREGQRRRAKAAAAAFARRLCPSR